MTRPTVSVVVPFAGDVAQALVALALLRSLDLGPGDERILVDNAGTVPAAADLEVVRADGEHSPAHARNAGASRARGEWILFLDADVRAPSGLIDAFFATPVEERVGALAGEIGGASGQGRSLVARYGATRNFLSQSAHLQHPFRPRAAAANLLVRRRAFEAAGGFREGLRAAEDTDFCWRLQDLGWALELRPQAAVLHEYRGTLRELRHQWRAYAAGRAWLAREYPGFRPQPAAARALRRGIERATGRTVPARPLSPGPKPHPGVVLAQGSPSRATPTAATPTAAAGAATAAGAGGRLERFAFLAIDAVLAVEELIGLRMDNRP